MILFDTVISGQIFSKCVRASFLAQPNKTYVGCPPHANPSAESRTAVSKSATSSQKNETGQ